MKISGRIRLPLAACTGFGGAALLVSLAMIGERIPESAAAASAADAAPAAGSPVDPAAAFCHTSSAAAAQASAAIRLAASRTEVPQAEMQAATPAPAFADSDPPLWDGLGSVAYKITTANPAAQTYFDQGLRLTYAFNHGEAQRAFHKAQKLDPTCVMCFWGEALVLGPNINLPMQQDAVAP